LSSERLEDLLTTHELFFAHLPTLEDSHEGALTERTREHLATWFQLHDQLPRERAYEQVDDYLKAQSLFYVNCWHMNDHESYLMWRAYGGRGFAVVTTFERLQAALDDSPAAITGGVVDYVDFTRELTDVGNVFHHVATKDLPYRDEREFRLVYWKVDPRNVELATSAKGVRVKVNLRMLIHNIVRSPYPETMHPELERLFEINNITFNDSLVSPRRPGS
jgi:hypothetical protein